MLTTRYFVSCLNVSCQSFLSLLSGIQSLAVHPIRALFLTFKSDSTRYTPVDIHFRVWEAFVYLRFRSFVVLFLTQPFDALLVTLPLIVFTRVTLLRLFISKEQIFKLPW